MYMYMYIYIIRIYHNSYFIILSFVFFLPLHGVLYVRRAGQEAPRGAQPVEAYPPDAARQLLGRHYLSNATRLMRPHLFHALFIASKITILCQTIRHFEENQR